MDIYNYAQFDDTEEYKKQMIKSFGENIRKIRIGKNLTQEKLAEMSSLNEKFLGSIERGEKTPSAITIFKISRSLNVPVCELFSIKDCPCRSAKIMKEADRLFAGKKRKDIEKAIRILEVFFE